VLIILREFCVSCSKTLLLLQLLAPNRATPCLNVFFSAAPKDIIVTRG